MRLTFVLPLVLTLAAASGPVPEAAPPPAEAVAAPTDPVLDSVRADLSVGRYWHAARRLRAMDRDGWGAAEFLLLARAEAGWGNWPEVIALLEGEDWLDAGEGEGRYLLARAYDEEARAAEAADAYRTFLDGPSRDARRRAVAALRGARALWRAGRHEDAAALLEDAPVDADGRAWLALELAEESAAAGNPHEVRTLLRLVETPEAREAAWRVEADALLAAGDTAGAVAAYTSLETEATGRRRAEAAVRRGLLMVALGEEAAGRALLRRHLDDVRGALRRRAAAALLDAGDTDLETTLRLGRILDREGDGRRALRAYDRAMRLAAAADVEVPVAVRIERARLMGTVPSRRGEAIEEFRAIAKEVNDPRLGARNLELWAGLRRRQGLERHVAVLRRWLLERYPGSEEAVAYVFGRASNADLARRFDAALVDYAFIARHAPTHARAGQGRMRTGQIHLARGDEDAALSAYESYLEDFPDGRRWQEASYWAARLHLLRGDTAMARARVARILREDPVSYYAVVGSELLGIPYRVDVPPAPAASVPSWVAEGVARVRMLQEAGLHRGADATVRALERRTAGPDQLLAVAEALIDAGRTIDGINVAWRLRREGAPWNDRLLRVAFPFPYRDLVRREAEEWGVDPVVLAAIIRQESAFKADIVSPAGAVGLMQVMPPTGTALARAHGPEPFDADQLRTPEVNLHLGAAFFVEMSERYDGDLPLVLSAYNAGPTRATRWRRFPEAADPLRFAERIPFTETRGYVKNVRRNLSLYQVLYAEDGSAP